MADPKKILYARFASTSGRYQYVLTSQSSDNMVIPSPTVINYSKNKALNQVGCGIAVWDSSGEGNTDYKQMALYDALWNNGYGDRNQCVRSLLAKNVPLYLNGVTHNQAGDPMPYVMWVDGSYTTVLHYFRADGTDLGWMFNPVYNDRYPFFFAGQLYQDGTFTGDVGAFRPHEIVAGVYSKKYYDWWVTGHVENAPFIKQSIIDDLTEYLPFEPEGELTENGNGDFDDTSDPIEFPDLPSISVLDTGMTQIYEMTSSQLRSLSSYLWTTNFDTLIKKMFGDPMEAILNLCISPLDLTTGSVESAIRIGNITTDVTGQRIPSPYKIIDFGSININEYWADFADYSPYTKISIYLPYVGVQSLSIDDVMNGTIYLKAYCDVLTGSVQYMLKSKQGNRRGHGHNSVLYTWGGNCQYQVPLSASNMSSVISSLISSVGTVAGAIGSTVATGGMTAPIAIGTVGSVMSNVMSAKTHVQRGGGLGGAVGLFGVQTPYLILERPEQINPQNYNATVGSPNECTNYLSNYAGFVKIKGVNLKINKATESELNEIENLLKGGVLV